MGNTEHPGRLNRGIEDFLEEQYEKVRHNKKQDFLTVSEVLEMRHPEDFPFPFVAQHVGVLFKCDRELDGVYTMDDLRSFALWIQQKLQGVQTYEFRAQLQAEAMDCMLEMLFSPNGERKLLDWFLRLLLRDNHCLNVQSQLYIRMEELRVLYDIFNVKLMHDMDIQPFFSLARMASEEMNLKIEERLEEGEQQEYIAVAVCEHFLQGFVRGLTKITREVGYDRDFNC